MSHPMEDEVAKARQASLERHRALRFKVGDRVKIISAGAPSYFVPSAIGKTGQVVNIESLTLPYTSHTYRYHLHLENSLHQWGYDENLEPATIAPEPQGPEPIDPPAPHKCGADMKFLTGDEVVCTAQDPAGYLSVGAKYVVMNFSGHDGVQNLYDLMAKDDTAHVVYCVGEKRLERHRANVGADMRYRAGQKLVLHNPDGVGPSEGGTMGTMGTMGRLVLHGPPYSAARDTETTADLMYVRCGDGHIEHCFVDRVRPEPDPIPPYEPPRALRFNEGKAQLFYADMFPDALREVCRTLMYGTQREVNPYPKFNWTKGAPYTELYDCARRHMQDWLNGAQYDRDAEEQKWKVHNLAFAVGNLLRLLQQELDGRTDLDDRGYRQGKEPAGEQG